MVGPLDVNSQTPRNTSNENSGGNRDKEAENSRDVGNQQTASSSNARRALTPIVNPAIENVGEGGGDGRKPTRQNRRIGGCIDSTTSPRFFQSYSHGSDDNESSRQQGKKQVDEGRECQGDIVHDYDQLIDARAIFPTKLCDNAESEFAIRPIKQIEKPQFRTHMEQNELISHRRHSSTVVADSLTPRRKNNQDRERVITEDGDQQGTSSEMAQPEINEEDENEHELENYRVEAKSSDEMQENLAQQNRGSPSIMRNNVKLAVNTTEDVSRGNRFAINPQQNFLACPVQENTTFVKRCKGRLLDDNNHNSQTVAENSLINTASIWHNPAQQSTAKNGEFVTSPSASGAEVHDSSHAGETPNTSQCFGLQADVQSISDIQTNIPFESPLKPFEEMQHNLRASSSNAEMNYQTLQVCIKGARKAANPGNKLISLAGTSTVEESSSNDEIATKHFQVHQVQLTKCGDRLAEEPVEPMNKDVNSSNTEETSISQLVQYSDKVYRDQSTPSAKTTTSDWDREMPQKDAKRKFSQTFNKNDKNIDSILCTNANQAPGISQPAGPLNEVIGERPQALIPASTNTTAQALKSLQKNIKRRKLEHTSAIGNPPSRHTPILNSKSPQTSIKKKRERLPTLIDQPSCSTTDQNPGSRQIIIKRRRIERPLALTNQQSSSASEQNPKTPQMNDAKVMTTLSKRRPDLRSNDSQRSALLSSPNLAEESLDTGQIASVENIVPLQKHEEQQVDLFDNLPTPGTSRANTSTFGGALFHVNADHGCHEGDRVRECPDIEQPYQTSVPSMVCLDPLVALFSPRLRLARRTEERTFLHPEGQSTGRVLRQCLHCGQRIHCLQMRICGNCERPWCEACRLWCGEPEVHHDIDLRRDDELSKKASSG